MNDLLKGVSGVRIVNEPGNGEILELENAWAAARIALKGAKVLSFIPRGGVEVIGGVSGDAKAAVESYLAGTLAPRADFKCNHHHHEDGHTCGGHHNDGGDACGGHCH